MVIQPWVLLEQTDYGTHQAQLTASAAARGNLTQGCCRPALLQQ